MGPVETDDELIDGGDDLGGAEDADVVDVVDPDDISDPPRLDARLRWAALAVNAGMAVAIVQALFVFLTVVQGLSLRPKADNFPSDVFHRIGIAFSTGVNIPSALALLVAVFLVTVPSFLGAAGLLRSRRARTLVVVDVVAAVICAGTILGVRASLHAARIPATGRVSPYQRWELAAYLAGTLGTALVAFLVSMAAMPARDS